MEKVPNQALNRVSERFFCKTGLYSECENDDID